VFPYVSKVQGQPNVTVHVYYKCYKRLNLILWPQETCDTYIVQPSIPYAMSLYFLLVVTLILIWGGFIVCGVGAQWLLTDCTCNSFASSLHRGPLPFLLPPQSQAPNLNYAIPTVAFIMRRGLICSTVLAFA